MNGRNYGEQVTVTKRYAKAVKHQTAFQSVAEAIS